MELGRVLARYLRGSGGGGMTVPVVGFRLWRYGLEDELFPWLESWSRPFSWSPRRVTRAWATEGLGADDGLHAVHDLFHSIEGFPRLTDPSRFWSKRWIVGAVAGYGNVHIHEHGFRAEYARPLGFLWHTRNADEDLRAELGDKPPAILTFLADEYRVPIVDTEADLYAIAGEMGRFYRERLPA